LQVEALDDFSLRYYTAKPEIANPLLLHRLHEIGAEVLMLSQVPRSLEEVYLKLVEDRIKSQVTT
jgi:ABC-2 type transport system ATP-binding protein